MQSFLQQTKLYFYIITEGKEELQQRMAPEKRKHSAANKTIHRRESSEFDSTSSESRSSSMDEAPTVPTGNRNDSGNRGSREHNKSGQSLKSDKARNVIAAQPTSRQSGIPANPQTGSRKHNKSGQSLNSEKISILFF